MASAGKEWLFIVCFSKTVEALTESKSESFLKAVSECECVTKLSAKNYLR